MSKLAAAYCVDGFNGLPGTCTLVLWYRLPILKRECRFKQHREGRFKQEHTATWISCFLEVRLQAEVVMSNALLKVDWLGWRK